MRSGHVARTEEMIKAYRNLVGKYCR